MKASAELKKLIDELGPIEAELAQLDAKYGIAGKEKRAQALRKTINDRIEAKPDEQVKIDASQYVALVSERRAESTIDIPGVFRLLGRPAFLKACSFTLTKLKDLVRDEAARDALVTVKRTGPRSVRTYRIAA